MKISKISNTLFKSPITFEVGALKFCLLRRSLIFGKSKHNTQNIRNRNIETHGN